MARTVTGTLTVNGNAVSYAMLLPRDCKNDWSGALGRRAIVFPHGLGGSAAPTIAQAAFAPTFFGGDHTRVWADAGFVVAAIDNASEFFNNDALDRQNALIDRLINVLGCKPRVGFGGGSMGGGTALAYHILNPGKVSCIYAYAPALDLRWLAGAAGYTPAYATGGLTPDPTWATTIATDYPSGYTSHDPLQNIAAFRNTVPIKIVHSTSDTTVPVDGTRYFVSQVNDPLVTERLPEPTAGGHVGVMLQVPPAETLAFYTNNWVD